MASNETNNTRAEALALAERAKLLASLMADAEHSTPSVRRVHRDSLHETIDRLTDQPSPSLPAAPQPGDGASLSQRLKALADAFACYHSGGEPICDLPVRRELFALIDHACIGLDSPPTLPAAEKPGWSGDPSTQDYASTVPAEREGLEAWRDHFEFWRNNVENEVRHDADWDDHIAQCCFEAGFRAALSPTTPAAARPSMEEMVNRFLSWPLPESVNSDGCVVAVNYPHPRYGTNLLTANEARQMLEHVLGGAK